MTNTVASKYVPLGYYLDHTDALQITLSFKDIERILDFGLPTAARRPEWWANKHVGGARQCDAWLRVGWQVFHVDVRREGVTFVRQSAVKGRDPRDFKHLSAAVK